MKIFLICPVRNASDEVKAKLEKFVLELEKQGDSVYYPARDTNQVDDTGYRICCDNCSAIKNADAVYVVFDPASSGSLFDLGMAFAMGKNLIIVNASDLKPTEGKSFTNMLLRWETIK